MDQLDNATSRLKCSKSFRSLTSCQEVAPRQGISWCRTPRSCGLDGCVFVDGLATDSVAKYFSLARMCPSSRSECLGQSAFRQRQFRRSSSAPEGGCPEKKPPHRSTLKQFEPCGTYGRRWQSPTPAREQATDRRCSPVLSINRPGRYSGHGVESASDTLHSSSLHVCAIFCRTSIRKFHLWKLVNYRHTASILCIV